ncbi:hypothetical protein KKF97_00200, partial [Myxococcota bacterium]|nr:hypothetical protein [Myxococcota bacterium]
FDGSRLLRLDWNNTGSDSAFTRRWMHPDHLGTASLISNDAGDAESITIYLPYGAVLEEKSETGFRDPYGFTGKELEVDLGIMYFGARWYNPQLGRWLSPDPLYLVTTAKNAEKDQNIYHYAGNNPWKFVDPDGTKNELTEGLGKIVTRGDAEGTRTNAPSADPRSAAEKPKPAGEGKSLESAKRYARFAELQHKVKNHPIIRKIESAGEVVDGVVKHSNTPRGKAETALMVCAFTPKLNLICAPAATYYFTATSIYSGASEIYKGNYNKGALYLLSSVFIYSTGPKVSRNPAYKIKDHIEKVNPSTLRWTQRTAGGNGRAAALRESMRSKGYVGEPIDVVRTADGLVTLDHTRAGVALELGIKKIPVRVHLPSDPLPANMIGRFGSAKTWGEAVVFRTANQRPPLPSTGTQTPPRLPRK